MINWIFYIIFWAKTLAGLIKILYLIKSKKNLFYSFTLSEAYYKQTYWKKHDKANRAAFGSAIVFRNQLPIRIVRVLKCVKYWVLKLPPAMFQECSSQDSSLELCDMTDCLDDSRLQSALSCDSSRSRDRSRRSDSRSLDVSDTSSVHSRSPSASITMVRFFHIYDFSFSYLLRNICPVVSPGVFLEVLTWGQTLKALRRVYFILKLILFNK